jgi:hypothetical protein
MKKSKSTRRTKKLDSVKETNENVETTKCMNRFLFT